MLVGYTSASKTLDGTSLEAGESSKAYKRSHNETINQIPNHHTRSFTGRVGPQARLGSPSSTLPARPSSSPSPRKTPLAPVSQPHPIFRKYGRYFYSFDLLGVVRYIGMFRNDYDVPHILGYYIRNIARDLFCF